MQKQDLKTGTKVVVRNGEDYTVLLGTKFGDILSSNALCGGFNELSLYDENLRCSPDESFDIIEVYSPKFPGCILKDKSMTLEWKETTELKELTMEDIEKKFGCRVKIVKN